MEAYSTSRISYSKGDPTVVKRSTKTFLTRFLRSIHSQDRYGSNWGSASSNGSLTYNWNTKGAGFHSDFGRVTCLALNRTGALPVTYLPEGVGGPPLSVAAAEDKAYNYFSSLGDPNLTRVVQYAALYQIFSAFDVARSSKPVPADSYPAELLEAMTTELNNSLKTASDAELQKIAEQLMPSIRLSLEETISSSMKAHVEDVKKEINQLLLSKGYRPGTKEYADNFDFLLSDWKKKQEESVRQNLTNLIKEQLTLAKRVILLKTIVSSR